MNASDLHLSAGLPATFRVDGELVTPDGKVLSHEDVMRLVHSAMSVQQIEDWQAKHECDFSHQVGGLSRFRVNAFQQVRGAAAVFRVVPSRVYSLEDLNAPLVFKKIADARNGLVLVTGPTGSGKSTTLAAMVDHINHSKPHHILTVEDPIEFVHSPVKSLINQRELGAQTLSFSNALRAGLREDPDVILVGGCVT